MSEDRKIDQRIMLELDVVTAGKTGVTTVNEIVDKVLRVYPYRKWQEAAMLEAARSYLSGLVKQHMKAPIPQDYIDTHYPHVDTKLVPVLSKIPSYICGEKGPGAKWTSIVHADQDLIRVNMELRTEFAQYVRDANLPFRRLLDRMEKYEADTVGDLLDGGAR